MQLPSENWTVYYLYYVETIGIAFKPIEAIYKEFLLP